MTTTNSSEKHDQSFQTEREKAFSKLHESIQELKVEYVRTIVTFTNGLKESVTKLLFQAVDFYWLSCSDAAGDYEMYGEVDAAIMIEIERYSFFIASLSLLIGLNF